MKAKPIKRGKKNNEDGSEYNAWILCSVEEATHIELNLPCPLNQRIIPVIINGSRDNNKRYVWTWNGDIEKPTLRPSVLTEGGRYNEDFSEYTKYKCHTWITDGEAQFLSDCTHDKVNQKLPLLEVVDDVI